nr:hypothetical protein [Candidatus Enterovibrio luxaltus]
MIDINTHEMMIAELSALNIIDGKILANSFKQTRRRINEISADGAYETRQYYETVHIKQAIPLIPPKKDAFLKNEVIRII